MHVIYIYKSMFWHLQAVVGFIEQYESNDEGVEVRRVGGLYSCERDKVHKVPLGL